MPLKDVQWLWGDSVAQGSGLCILLMIWKKETLASGRMKGQCHPARPTSVGQKILDFKAWIEEKSKLTTELKKKFSKSNLQHLSN